MSRDLRVARTIPAPARDVFAMFADSDRFGTRRGLRVTVLRPGSGSRDGVDLLRRLDLGAGLFLVEEVVGLDPPHVFDYRIRDGRPRVRHQQGRITFTASGSGTVVEWSSTFSVPAGPATPLAEAGAALVARAAFRVVLARIERTLATDASR